MIEKNIPEGLGANASSHKMIHPDSNNTLQKIHLNNDGNLPDVDNADGSAHFASSSEMDIGISRIMKDNGNK